MTPKEEKILEPPYSSNSLGELHGTGHGGYNQPWYDGKMQKKYTGLHQQLWPQTSPHPKIAIMLLRPRIQPWSSQRPMNLTLTLLLAPDQILIQVPVPTLSQTWPWSRYYSPKSFFLQWFLTNCGALHLEMVLGSPPTQSPSLKSAAHVQLLTTLTATTQSKPSFVTRLIALASLTCLPYPMPSPPPPPSSC